MVNVQEGMVALKLSERGVVPVPELEDADALRFMDWPAQMGVADAKAVTLVGVGFTTSVFVAVAATHVPPLVVNVSVTVPVKEGAGV